MDEAKYLKGPCAHCGMRIEFPASMVGLTIECPHCSAKTVLTATTPAPTSAVTERPLQPGNSAIPAESSATGAESSARPVAGPGESQSKPDPDLSATAATSGSRRKRVVVGVIAIVVIAVALAVFWLGRRGGAGSRANGGQTSPSNAVVEAAEPKAESRPRSRDDLSVGQIALEKGRGGNLVYATGVLKNNSDHQRFGVTIEVALTDKAGQPAGKATDYRDVIEPRAEWRFRALVLNRQAAKARLASITEAE